MITIKDVDDLIINEYKKQKKEIQYEPEQLQLELPVDDFYYKNNKPQEKNNNNIIIIEL